jgi:hypothetical protein
MNRAIVRDLLRRMQLDRHLFNASLVEPNGWLHALRFGRMFAGVAERIGTEP